MFGTFDISASGLTAQRVRIETIASNIASADAVAAGVDENGRVVPYRRKFTVFETVPMDGGTGVRVKAIEEDQSPFEEKIEPGSRYADARGVVRYPNVKMLEENANALEAYRAYEANVTAIETTKSMMNATLRVLA
jgi:flagellar basal-body rod protein FlgC